MKKIICMLAVLCISISVVFNVSAAEKTLRQLKADAEANREAYAKAKNDKAMTEEERDKTTAEKQQVQAEISSIQEETKKIEQQIIKLQENIKKKDKQMKDIMGFVQVSNSESNYMEYIFGTTDFTDFIYRISVAEQLNDYNDKLIDSYNNDVKNLDEKQKQLSIKQQDLVKKEQELSVLEAKLNDDIEAISEGMLSKEEEYRTQISLINNLTKKECMFSTFFFITLIQVSYINWLVLLNL